MRGIYSLSKAGRRGSISTPAPRESETPGKLGTALVNPAKTRPTGLVSEPKTRHNALVNLNNDPQEVADPAGDYHRQGAPDHDSDDRAESWGLAAPRRKPADQR